MQKTYTVKQVAEILGYSTNSIYTFVKEKRIKAVRVGRGRFRIPQAEVDRLLMQKSGHSAHEDDDEVLPELAREIAPHLSMPNFADWFLGMSSIIMGASLILFTRTLEGARAERLLPFMPTIQTVLAAGGLGLLLTDMVGKKARAWHGIFHTLVTVGWSGLAVGLALIGDIEGGVLYGSVGVVAGIASILGLGGVASFTLVVCVIVSLIGPSAILLFPNDPHVAWAYRGLGDYGYVLWIIGGMVAGAAIVVSYHKSGRAYFIFIALVSAVFIGLSFWFAAENYWSRAFFLLLLGVMGLFAQLWRELNFTHESDRRVAFGLGGTVLLSFLLAVGAVVVFQANMRLYAQESLARKQDFAREFIQGVLVQTKMTLESAAGNAEVGDAIGEKDLGRLTGFARGYFESNPYVYRVIFATPAGDIMAYYPLADALTVTNIAFRDYFIRAVTTKSTVLSDVFEAATESKSKRIVYAVPILDKKKDVVGVVVGGLSLERLGAKLQQIASEKNGEYVLVVDSAGNRIIHPDKRMVGQLVDQTSPLMAALAGQAGVVDTYTDDGKQSFIAYGPIDHSVGWAVGIQAPMVGVLGPTAAASVVIFFVVGISLTLTLGFTLFRRGAARRTLERGFSDTS